MQHIVARSPTELIWHPFYMKLYEKANMATLECKECIIKSCLYFTLIYFRVNLHLWLLSHQHQVEYWTQFCAILSNFGPFLISSGFFCLFLTLKGTVFKISPLDVSRLQLCFLALPLQHNPSYNGCCRTKSSHSSVLSVGCQSAAYLSCQYVSTSTYSGYESI